MVSVTLYFGIRKAGCPGGLVLFFVDLQRFFLWSSSIPEQKKYSG
jgi:hypothetical protein